ncbi:MAG: DUF4412 domain-containing protein [Candidatus Anammoxibacter sp.]
MKKIAFTVFCFLFCMPTFCFAIDLEDVEGLLGQLGLKDAIESTVGIDIDKVTDYLHWAAIKISLRADMPNTTDIRGKIFQVDSTIYKRGISNIRIDVKTGLNIPGTLPSTALANLYMLQYPLKRKGYLVSPLKKSYMKLDPERGREMRGELKERFSNRSVTTKTKESLGDENINGYLCNKVHVVAVSDNGTKNDMMVWLAYDLKNFPIKIISHFENQKGVKGINTTIFSNIKVTEPDKSLFEIPDDYIKCDNIIGLLSGGKFGSRLRKRKK